MPVFTRFSRPRGTDGDGPVPRTPSLAAPATGDTVPAVEAATAAADDGTPDADGTRPATDDAKPATDDARPATDDATPNAGHTKPDGNDVEPDALERDPVGPDADHATPAPHGVTPDPGHAPPGGGGTEPDAGDGAPGTAGTAPVAADEVTPAQDEADSEDARADEAAAPAAGPAPQPAYRTTVIASLRARLAHRRTWRTRHPAAARALRRTTTVLAAALVLGALLLPNTLAALHPNRFLRMPAEAVVAAAVLIALPRRPRVVVAAVTGAGLGVLTVLNLLDMGFTEYLGRGFNLVLDWGLLDDAQAYVEDTMGRAAAIGAAVGLVVLVLLVLTVMALATVRLAGLLGRDTRAATRGTLVAGTVWITCSTLGLQIAGVPVASDRAANAVEIQARRVRDTLRDEAAFAEEASADTFGATPGDELVPDLRGKDMIFTFIESYGRSAIEDPVIAPGVDRTLDASTAALARAGFHAKSGWLTSATYGGSSWLGHSSTLSGLWIDNQQRYRTVMAGDHLSLTKAFRKTGDWDTVGVMPGIQKGWPEAKYYGLDKVYNAFEMGYKGPKFSWSTMPDQYALEAFQRLEHGRKRDKPLMSEIILTSSHQPWAPIPRTVGWDELGDGSVFGPIEAAGNDPADVVADSTRSKQEYGKSIQYSVTSLTQWLERYGTDDTVLVFLGDHQPIARVSGDNASRDVPISVVAKDPKVLDKIAAWHWTDGLRPAHDAPVWRMSSFRDRFLTAYGSTPHPSRG